LNTQALTGETLRAIASLGIRVGELSTLTQQLLKQLFHGGVQKIFLPLELYKKEVKKKNGLLLLFEKAIYNT
jgi:hypothetical protein